MAVIYSRLIKYNYNDRKSECSFAFNYQGVRLSIGCLSKVRCICIPKQREIIQNIKKNIPASFEYSQFMPWLKQGFLQV